VAVLVDTTSPVVTITSPNDGAKLNNGEVTVTGTVSDDNIDKVTVNGVEATVEDGTFTATITLDEGEHTITVVATDVAGNETVHVLNVSIDTTPPELSNPVSDEEVEVNVGDPIEIVVYSEPGLNVYFMVRNPS